MEDDMRLRTRRDRATEADALDALLGIWGRHGLDTFALNARGPLAGALLYARHLGWLWGDGCGMHVTLAGVAALSGHLGRDLLGEWVAGERAAASEPEPAPAHRYAVAAE
jgi:hypothetical protein